MRKLRLIGVAGLAVAAIAIPSGSATAETLLYRCPDQYQPVPTQAVPPQKKDKDRNMNFVVCAKGPQGNGHFNVKDDKGETVSPTLWSITSVDTLAWLVTNNLDPTGVYSLDPEPEDVVDDF